MNIKGVFVRAFYLAVVAMQFVDGAFAMASRSVDPNAPPPPAWVSFFPMIVIFLILYLMILRPQSRQRRERHRMLEAVKKGDKIVTQGGLHAVVMNISPKTLEVKLGEETRVTMQRSAVAEILLDDAAHAAAAIQPR